ncbi:MAG: undecaprenyldiphospho-muramoylpentapeptide beta-N-acetylglucosaminyltransferase, partial [Nitrospirota bacterium]
LLELKASKMILDHELTGEILAKHIRELYENKDLRHEMEKQSRSVGRADAAQRVVDIAISLAKNR